MAGKNNGGLAYSTADVEVMKNAFGPLVVAVQQQMDEVMKVWHGVAFTNEPFEDGTPQKASFQECVTTMEESVKHLSEKFEKSKDLINSYTEKFEAAMRGNARYAEQAAQAVAQASAKARDRQAN